MDSNIKSNAFVILSEAKNLKDSSFQFAPFRMTNGSNKVFGEIK